VSSGRTPVTDAKRLAQDRIRGQTQSSSPRCRTGSGISSSNSPNSWVKSRGGATVYNLQTTDPVVARENPRASQSVRAERGLPRNTRHLSGSRASRSRRRNQRGEWLRPIRARTESAEGPWDSSKKPCFLAPDGCEPGHSGLLCVCPDGHRPLSRDRRERGLVG